MYLNDSNNLEKESIGFSSGNFIVKLIKFLILLLLFGLFFNTKITNILTSAFKNSENVHIALLPVIIALYLYLRRQEFKQNITGSGSFFGIIFIAGGLFIYSVFTWPFEIAYFRDISMIPILAGIVLVIYNKQIFKLALPLLFFGLIAIPIGQRTYAYLIIKPETYTVKFAGAAIDSLPQVRTDIKGTDLYYYHNGSDGIIGLGESNRGIKLVYLYSTLGLFVTFSKKRSIARITIALISIPLLVLLCNFIRFLTWGLICIYTNPQVTSNYPKFISAAISLLIAYGLFVFINNIQLYSEGGKT